MTVVFVAKALFCHHSRWSLDLEMRVVVMACRWSAKAFSALSTESANSSLTKPSSLGPAGIVCQRGALEACSKDNRSTEPGATTRQRLYDEMNEKITRAEWITYRRRLED